MQASSTIIAYDSSGQVAYTIILGTDDGSVLTFAGSQAAPDSTTAVLIAENAPPWNVTNGYLPAGLSLISSVPGDYDPLFWYAWKIVAGQLVKKTRIGLKQVSRTIFADAQTTTLQVGSATANVIGGQAALPADAVGGTPVFVARSDPDFYSDPPLYVA